MEDSYFSIKSNNVQLQVEPYDQHQPYVSQAYEDDHFLSKTQRRVYIDAVNKWLDTPLYSVGYDSNDNGVFNTYEDDVDCEDEDDEDNEVLVKSVCCKIYNELMTTIKDNGFLIYDENQFKEDFIHYMYSLSLTV